MTTYQITSKTGGVDMGTFEAASPREAVEAMWTEAGCCAPFDATNADGELLCDESDLIVREVKANHGTLHDHRTGEEIRPATADEHAASIEAAERDGGSGVIEVDGRYCYVAD